MSDLTSSVDYQLQTIYFRDAMLGGNLDWSNQPDLYKAYENAESIPLPRNLILPRADIVDVLKGRLNRAPQQLDLAILSNLLFLSYGFTDQIQHGPEVFLYRSAPSAGALYPVEIYLVAKGISGLEDGLYHYSIIDFALTRLKKATPPEDIPAPALVLTSIFFRSAWKYKNRAYRYCLLDTGHVAENINLVAPALGLNVNFSSNFDDKKLNNYLGLDSSKETALTVFTFNGDQGESGKGGEEAEPLSVPTSAPVAKNELVFDMITDAVNLTSKAARTTDSLSIEMEAERIITPPQPEWEAFESTTLAQAIQKRRSRRNFKPRDIVQKDLARILDLAVNSDVNKYINLYFAVNEVQDLSDGLYNCLSGGRIAQCLRGFISPSIGDTALNQDWVGRGNLIFIISAPLKKLEEHYGPRAYRMAYLAAGGIGQRLYLAAEAMQWGCCGVGAFFDEDARKILNLPDGEFPLYILPVGPVKRRTHGGRPANR